MSFAIFVSDTATVLRAPGGLNEGVAGRLGLERVGGCSDREACLLREPRADALGELGVRVEAGADGRPAERDLAEPRQRVLDARDALAHLGRVATELLAERHRHGVHEMGPA